MEFETLNSFKKQKVSLQLLKLINIYLTYIVLSDNIQQTTKYKNFKIQ